MFETSQRLEPDSEYPPIPDLDDDPSNEEVLHNPWPTRIRELVASLTKAQGDKITPRDDLLIRRIAYLIVCLEQVEVRWSAQCCSLIYREHNEMRNYKSTMKFLLHALQCLSNPGLTVRALPDSFGVCRLNHHLKGKSGNATNT